MSRLAEIGQELKEAREARKRTLEDIATETHLKLNHLQALEAGDESRLPEPVYIKSFVRKYAQAVGLPADELANRYWETRPLPPPPPQTREFNIPWWAYVVLLGVLLFGLIAVAWHYSTQAPSTAPSPAATKTPAPHATPASPSVPVQLPAATGMPAPGTHVATGGAAPHAAVASPSAHPALQVTPAPKPTTKPAVAPTPKPTAKPLPKPTAHPTPKPTAKPTPKPTPKPMPHPTAAPAATSTVSTAPAEGVSGNNSGSSTVLTLHAVGSSWVRVMRDGRTIYEDTMAAGDAVHWPIGSGLTVTIGNGAAIEASAGDQKFGVMGGKNQVVRRLFK